MPSPVISVVTPCMIFDAARPSTRTLNSDCPSMSMKPGATTRPVASTVWRAGRPARSPMAAMRSPAMREIGLQPRRAGAVDEPPARDEHVVGQAPRTARTRAGFRRRAAAATTASRPSSLAEAVGLCACATCYQSRDSDGRAAGAGHRTMADRMALIDLRSDTLSMPTPEMLQSIATAHARRRFPRRRSHRLELEARGGADARQGGRRPDGQRLDVQHGGAADARRAWRRRDRGGVGASLRHGVQRHRVGVRPARDAGARPARRAGSRRRALGGEARSKTMFPATGLVCLENTHNAAGGTVITPDALAEIAAIAHDAGMPVHLDGARLFNAAVALGVDGRGVDASGRLRLHLPLEGAVGADRVRAGGIGGVHRSRPQGPQVAGRRHAPGRHHRGARAWWRCAPAWSASPRTTPTPACSPSRSPACPGCGIDLATVQTNIVNLDVSGLGIDAATFASHLAVRGVRGLPGMGASVRFVTYRGITRADIETAVAAVKTVVAEHPWAA